MAKKEDDKPLKKNEKIDQVNLKQDKNNEFAELMEEAEKKDATDPEMKDYLEDAIRKQIIERSRSKPEKEHKRKEKKEKKEKSIYDMSETSSDSDSDFDSIEEVKFTDPNGEIKKRKKTPEERKKEREEEMKEIARILEEHTPVDYVSNRAGNSGASFKYIEGHTAIQLANAIFGPFNWSTEVTSINVNYVEKTSKGIEVCTTAIVKVKVNMNGHESSHEDLGVGKGKLPDKAQAYSLSQKSAITSATKRALRQFGNILGNSLYDKAHIDKLDTNHRHIPDIITHDSLRKKIKEEREKRKQKEDNDNELKTDDMKKEKGPKKPNKLQLEEKTENKPEKKETKPGERKPEKKEDDDGINDDDIAQFFK